MAPPLLPREVAYRIGLAHRQLPGVGQPALFSALFELTDGRLTLETLQRIGPRRLRDALNQKAAFLAQGPGMPAPVTRGAVYRAVDCLRNQRLPEGFEAREPTPDGATEVPGPKLRVAISSNEGRWMDASFSQSRRLLVFEVHEQHTGLLEVREAGAPAGNHPGRDDDLERRVALVKDCSIVYSLLVANLAKARLVRVGVHPVSLHQALPSSHVLSRLQRVIRLSPPPWMGKALDASRSSTVPS